MNTLFRLFINSKSFLQDIIGLSENLAVLQAKDFAAIKELDHINQEIEKVGR